MKDNPHENVLNSEQPLPPNIAFRCSRCPNPGTHSFPHPNTGAQPEVYCEACLAYVKQRLYNALRT